MSFRQLDVDRLDPDSVVNTLPDVIPSGLGVDDIEAVVANARSSLQSGQTAAALSTLLEYPPYASDEKTKEIATAGVIQVLASARGSDINGIVEQLSATERATLMKFLYRAFSTKQGQVNGGVLLQWHEKVVEIGGQNVIVKHLTDRRTL